MEAAVKVSAQLLRCSSSNEFDVAALLNSLVSVSNPSTESTDARREAIITLKNVAKSKHEVSTP